MKRREFVTALGVGAAATTLVACGDKESEQLGLNSDNATDSSAAKSVNKKQKLLNLKGVERKAPNPFRRKVCNQKYELILLR